MTAQPNRLVMRTGPTPGKAFTLSKNEIYIGRDITNDIVINDAEVSRKHARLTLQTGGYLLEDLGSTNGTFVDGRRLAGAHVLTPGQVVMLADNVSLVYEGSQFDKEAAISGLREEITPPFTTEDTPAIQPVAPAGAPAYAGPAVPVEPVEEERSGRTQLWLLAGCGCLVLIIGAVILAGLYYIDTQNLWCDVLQFLPACQ